MRVIKNKKWIIMFGGWTCALILSVCLTCSSLSKYVSGELSENGAGIAVMNCSFTATVENSSLGFVNYDSSDLTDAITANNACVITYKVKNYSEESGVCEVAVRPHFRIYAAAEFLSKMAFQLAVRTDGAEAAVTPQYYMSAILEADGAENNSYSFGTDGYAPIRELGYTGGAETVTVTKSGGNYYFAECKANGETKAGITVTQTTAAQDYTVIFTRGIALTGMAGYATEDVSGNETTSTDETANDMSGTSFFCDVNGNKDYMCLDIELQGVSMPAGERAEMTYACYLVPTDNIESDGLGKSMDAFSVTGWHYDAALIPTDSEKSVTVRIKGEISGGETAVTYYALGDDGTETRLIESGGAYSGGGYTFSASELERYRDYTYNPNGENFVIGKSWGIVYPLQAKMLFEQAQGA